MLEKNRMNELFQKFVIAQDMPDDELTDLNLEELTYIYAATEATKKDNNLTEQLKQRSINMPIRQQIIYWRVVEAIKSADGIYVAFTEQPAYPYLDEAGNALVFSTEETAKKMAEHLLTAKKAKTVIRKLENKAITALFVQLYYIGSEQVLIDNGSHPMAVKRTDVLPEPEWKDENVAKQQVYNGKLQLYLIQFTQFIRTGEGTPDQEKLKTIDLLEKRMVIELVKSRFLVPMMLVDKEGKQIKPGEAVPNSSEVSRKLPYLTDGTTKSQWLPAFTDWAEFSRVYKPAEWGAAVVNYDGLIKIAKDTAGQIVVNAKGCGYRITEKTMGRIDSFIKVKNEIDAKRAEQGQNAAEMPDRSDLMKLGRKTAMPTPANNTTEKASNVQPRSAAAATYGDLLEEPDMLMAALKRTAKASKIVKRMWLAQRFEGDTTGYLLVVESSSESTNVMQDLKNIANGYLDGKTMECRLADPAALAIVKDIKPFYKKGIFG